MLAYLRYVKKPVLIRYFMVLLFFVLGLMSKPMLVTLPFVLLLMDYWPLQRLQFKDNTSLPNEKARFDLQRFFKLILEKIPFFILVVISCSLTFFAQKSGEALVPLEALSLKIRIANALISYVSYAFQAIWPSNLAIYYPHPIDTLPAWQSIGAALLIAVAIFLSIHTLKKYPYTIVGLFWYLGTLVPVIGLVQVGDQAMADRYTYIPLIGLFIIIAWGVSDLLAKWHCRKIFLGISAVIILSALTVCTFSQAGHWRNTITLFENTVKVTENNYKALNNLGAALVDKGKYDEALLYFVEAFRINPQKTDARNNLANMLFLQGKSDEAVSHYNEILKFNPQNIDALNNLANVLSAQGEIDKAVLLYKEVLSLDPENVDTHYNIGLFYKKQGKLKKAMTHLAEAIKIDPYYAEAYNEIGVILFQQGKYKKAGVFFSKAVQIKPSYTEAQKNISLLKRILSSSEK